ncbi:hypothetical protein [Paracoccus jiaweipingae]|uniref:hypothetical protein n=1 Tax=unclassified Paracoccus (in: a-proteobacteria) TaxID=2688777 RepID=UPI00379179A3
MPVKNKMFQPGLVLYEVVLGAFKASGTPFEQWCKANDISGNTARNALKGVYTGPTGQEVLDRLIEGAGADVVEVAYRARIARHAEQLKGAAA